MSNTRRPVLWHDLVDHLKTAKFGRIQRARRDIDDGVSDAGSEASRHSDISRYDVTPQERKTIRSLDHHRCFVTNGYSHGGEIAHILDSCNAKNRDLVDALRGLGIVHQRFNLADISNLILMSRDLHHLWDKHAAFVIVPSQFTRSRMIEILQGNRRRIVLAAQKGELVDPRQLAYPEVTTYDILLFQPSLFGSPKWRFSRADNHTDEPTDYIIPEESPTPERRLEYLKKQDGGTLHREFLNIQHVTERSRLQAVNPYLMVMNALQKLQYWNVELSPTPADPLFQAALDDCRTIMDIISTKPGIDIRMSWVKPNRQAQDSREYGASDGTSHMSLRALRPNTDLQEEPDPPAGSSPPKNDASAKRGMQSWISHGGSDKISGIENWRQEVKGIDTTVEALDDDLHPTIPRDP